MSNTAQQQRSTAPAAEVEVMPNATAQRSTATVEGEVTPNTTTQRQRRKALSNIAQQQRTSFAEGGGHVQHGAATNSAAQHRRRR